jgi:hypothetical protein
MSIGPKIPYIFSHLYFQTWNGMDGFWQNGIVVETMANTIKYGNHSRYLSVIKVRKIDRVHSGSFTGCPVYIRTVVVQNKSS